MEGGLTSRLARSQYRALAWVRIRIFVNSLRTMRGGLDLGAGILTYVFGAAVACGPAFGLGMGAWTMVKEGHAGNVAALLWVVFGVWQFFSAMAPAMAGQNPEMNHLLRYPVSFGSWVLLYLVNGIFSPSSLIGLMWCTGIGIGIGVARPDLAWWTALTLAIFALFNLLLSRTILAWVERWMSQRRTREVVTGVFLFVALLAQMLNPALYQHSRSLPFGLKEQTLVESADRVAVAQRGLPPGVASRAIANAMEHRAAAATGSLGWLALWTLGVGGLLGVRLRAESLGENLSETPRRSAPARVRGQAPPWRLLDFSGPLAAVFEKDLRYLLRSGPLLYALAAPPVMVVFFSTVYRNASPSGFRVEYALPAGLVWAFMGLTRMVFNSFGTEGEGIQFYFLSPTPARTVVLGKNALHLALFCVEAVLIGGIILFRFGLPDPAIGAATVAWLLFALPANFAIGNAASILMPYRANVTRMRSERGSLGNALLGLVTQFGILAVGAAVFAPFAIFGHPWLATPVLLALAALSSFAYLRVLANTNRMVRAHQEPLTLEVMKAR